MQRWKRSSPSSHRQLGAGGRSSMGSSRFQIIIWAALFFFGFTLLGALISWLLPVISGITWVRTGHPWEFPNLFLVIPFVLLLASYLSVRRLNHPLLSHLWLYAIVVSAIGFISAPVMASANSASTLGWWATAFGLASFIVLVWIARRISVMLFRHSVLFIALAAAVAVPNPNNFIPSHLDAYPSVAPSLPITITLWAGGVLLGILAVWALGNTETVVSTTKTMLPPVIMMLAAALIALGAAYVVESVHVLDWIVPMLTAGLSSLIAPALAAAITYAVRVRRPVGTELQPSQA